MTIREGEGGEWGRSAFLFIVFSFSVVDDAWGCVTTTWRLL